MDKMVWKLCVSVLSLDERPIKLSGVFDCFDDVINCLDILNDYYIMQSVLITRKPVNPEVCYDL